MTAEKELEFLKSTFKKCRVSVEILQMEKFSRAEDLPVRVPWQSGELLTALQNAEDRIIYRMTDAFFCSYLFFRLHEDGRLLLIGPYLSVDMTPADILQQVEKNALSPHLARRIEAAYGAIPVVTESNPLFVLVDTFCETLWGTEKPYRMVDVNQEQALSPLSPANFKEPQGDTLRAMREMEERYGYENALISAVSQGLSHKAELLFSGFSSLAFERRSADPVRNLKNYCIIMNTLLRKAAEQGGVHPIHLDRVSSDYAHRIEAITSTEAIQPMMGEMFRKYCRLVEKHATAQYTAPVQRAIVMIESDIAGDLSLQTLARRQSVNASYLSALFKKETGQNLTDFVAERRMRLAARLLSSSRLQIQTVAQYCGIDDVSYFSKLFKRYLGKTPKQYRAEHGSALI